MPIRKILPALSEFGAFDGLLYLAHRALGKLSGGRAGIYRYYLVAQPVTLAATTRDGRRPVRLIGSDDPLRAAFPRPPHVIAKRFRDGNLCFGAQVGERFAGFLWLARDTYEEDEVRCLYALAEPASSAWDYDVHVEPDFRLGRTFARLWEAANRHLSANGVRWTFSRISGFNPVSLRTHARLGIRPLFSATFLRFGGTQLTFAGAPPYLHLSLSVASRPTLRLSPPECRHSANNLQESSPPYR